MGPGLAVALLLALAGAASAQGTLATCVEVQGPDAEGLRRLVVSELERHPSHRAAAEGEDCVSHLRVEVIAVESARYVTGRVNAQVPHREVVTGDLADAVSATLRIVLHSDPVRLEDPAARDDWLRRQRKLLQKRGVMLFGVEAFELAGGVGGGLSALPGLALTARREVDQWHLGVRLAGAYAPFESDELGMVGHVAAHVELAYFASDVAPTTLFGSVMFGLEHQRFRGPSASGDARRGATATGFGVAVRGGMELFRVTDTRLQLFLQANVPAFTASDDDGGVVDAWVPTLAAGVGAAF